MSDDFSFNNIERSQIQQKWQLVAIDGQPINPKIGSSLVISTENKATGTLGCNAFFGALQLQDNKLKVDKMGSTRKRCLNGQSKIEKIVGVVLRDWSEVLLENGKMTLTSESHQLSYSHN